jgi:hypothetical protein
MHVTMMAKTRHSEILIKITSREVEFLTFNEDIHKITKLYQEDDFW